MSKVNKDKMSRGIGSLLSNIESGNKSKNKRSEASNGSTSEIDISTIEVNPFQPRVDFEEEALKELKESIAIHGVIQPITVRRLSANRYQIISGERRWRASQLAGKKTIPAYIREADDQGMLEMALLENIQRADLNPLEVALSYQRLLDECDLTHEELSERLGKKRSTITNHLRVLKLLPDTQKALRERSITLGHAKIIAGVDNVEEQAQLLELILKEGLSVRATEAASKKKSSSVRPNPTGSSAQTLHPEVKKYQNRLAEHIGSKVNIARSDNGRGSIKISFSSDDELNEIMDALLNA